MTFLILAVGINWGLIPPGFASAKAAVLGVSLAGTFVAGRFALRRFLQSRRQKLGALMRKLVNVSREAIEDHSTS